MPADYLRLLVNSQDGELFIYITNSISKSLHDVSLFGLMFDAYQFQETGKQYSQNLSYEACMQRQKLL